MSIWPELDRVREQKLTCAAFSYLEDVLEIGFHSLKGSSALHPSLPQFLAVV